MDRVRNKVATMEKLIPCLHSLLEKEERLWREMTYSSKDEVTGINRDKAVEFMIFLNQTFDFSPENLSLSISLFDKFLSLCKVQEKYTGVVSITCWFIASKIVEDSHPSAYEIAQQSFGNITKAELLRMEIIILHKLDYDTRISCGLEVLNKLHSLFLTAPISQTCHSHNLKDLTVQYLKCLSWHVIGTRVKPSHLALAIFVLHLEMVNFNWEELSTKICLILSINFDDLVKTKDSICHFLHNCYDQIKSTENSVYDQSHTLFPFY